MFIDLRESEREREKKKEKKEKKKTSVWERNIDWLPPICAPTWDQTHNLGMCPDWGSNRLQPTEPPGQGSASFFMTA